MKVNQEQLKVMLDSLDPKLDKQKVLTNLLDQGLVVEGFNEPVKEKGAITQTLDKLADRGSQIMEGFDKFGKYNQDVKNGAPMKDQAKDIVSGVSKIVGGVAGGVNDVVGAAVEGADKALFNGAVTETIGGVAKQVIDSKAGQAGIKLLNDYAPQGTAQRDAIDAVANVVGAIAPIKGVGTILKTGVVQTVKQGAKTTLSTIGKAAGIGKDIVANPNIVNSEVVNLAKNFFSPNTTETTLTALNPFKSDISLTSKISIPLNDGKDFIVKEFKDLTNAEQKLILADKLNSYKTYYDQGVKSTINAKELTPADIVAQNVDSFVEKANKMRQEVGKKMGEIEKTAKDSVVDLSNTKSLQQFVDNIKENITKKGYAGSKNLTDETKTFVKDLKVLQKTTPTVKEVLDFTRQWQTRLDNLKDNFGNFASNNYDNTVLQKMVGDIKNQARNTLSEVDDTYKGLVNSYRETSALRDTANRLLGKDGLYGDTLKGASVIKRAVKSISDNGSRQFLKKLEDITGYDGLSDAQIAIKAMEDAGDFRGLSLLEILSESSGKAGAIKDALKWTFQKVVPNEKSRVENYIKN